MSQPIDYESRPTAAPYRTRAPGGLWIAYFFGAFGGLVASSWATTAFRHHFDSGLVIFAILTSALATGAVTFIPPRRYVRLGAWYAFGVGVGLLSWMPGVLTLLILILILP